MKNTIAQADAAMSIKIWNPSNTANLSLLFTPLFGAYLHYRNWQAMGEHEQARAAMKWVIASVAVLVVTTLGAYADKNLSAIWLIQLFAWYFASAKKQIKYVNEHKEMSYTQSSLAKPALIALSILLAYLGLIAIKSSIHSGETENSFNANESEAAGEDDGYPDIPSIGFEDLYIDFNDYAGKNVSIEGVILSVGDHAYLNKEMGAITSFFLDISALSREEKKYLINDCGMGCQARIAASPVPESDPKELKALRILN